MGGIDARGRGVQRELADRNWHPSGPLVTEAQDSLVVGHYDKSDISIGRRTQDPVDATDVSRRDPDAPRAPEDVAELLAGATNGGGIDDRQELLEVIDEEAVEERLVAVLEGGEADVALEVVGLAPHVFELERDLLIHGRNAWGQQPAQPKLLALTLGEGSVLVEQATRDQVRPAVGDSKRTPRCFKRRGHSRVGCFRVHLRRHYGECRGSGRADGTAAAGPMARHAFARSSVACACRTLRVVRSGRSAAW